MNRPITTRRLAAATAANPAAGGPLAGTRSPFWALLLLLLAATVVFETWFDWSNLVRQGTVAPGGNPLARFTPEAGGQIDRRSDYSDYLAAPIFLASREPIVLPDLRRLSATAARSGNLGLALLGTVLSGDEPVALIKLMPDGEAVLLRQGEALGDWILLEIAGRLVRLQRGDAIFELYLDPTEQGAPGDGGRPRGGSQNN